MTPEPDSGHLVPARTRLPPLGGAMTANKARPVVAFIPPSCCGAGYFRRLRRALAGRVDVRAVELPGHGRRYQEPLLTRAGPAVLDIAGQIGGRVDAVYGESLGAYIGLAVVEVLGQPRPPLLLAASNSPPSVRARIRIEDIGSIATAVATLTAMGGQIPAELMADRDLAERAYPMIRDDLRLAQSFIDATRQLSIAGDIQALGGAEDTALVGLEAWARHTTGRCEVTRLPGGHLLSATNPSGVAALVDRSLAQW
jgi:surfactin synthase thioesterase subunit